jgi:hypothetical protein
MSVIAETHQIKEQALARLEEICEYLLPGGRKEGTHWRAGNINGDRGKSFAVNLTTGQFGDWASGDKMRTGVIDLWMAVKNIDFPTARKQLAGWLGITLSESNGLNGSFDWSVCVIAIRGSDKIREIEQWRGLSPKFCEWMISRKSIGLFTGCCAFPIYDDKGRVTSPHYLKNPPKEWLYFKGTHVTPLVLGDLEKATEVHIHESTWDGLAFCDVSEAYLTPNVCTIITRGASHANKLKDFIPAGKKVYVWPQNDEADVKTGKIASEEWFNNLEDNLSCAFFRVQTPTEFEDLNDWTRSGANKSDLLDAMENATLFEKEDPLAWLKPKSVSELTQIQPDQILRGILYQGCKMVLMAGSKSFKTWTLMDIAYCVANGLMWCTRNGRGFRDTSRPCIRMVSTSVSVISLRRYDTSDTSLLSQHQMTRCLRRRPSAKKHEVWN